MRFWIDDPSQSEPVSIFRWAAWKLGCWMQGRGEALIFVAMDQCPMCGHYRNGQPHENCDGIPF